VVATLAKDLPRADEAELRAQLSTVMRI
jgi:hypothetical protein